MDYGPDWPPTPSTSPNGRSKRPRVSLLEQCVWVVAFHVLVAVAGLIGLHVRQQYVPPFDPYGTQTTYATTTVGPPPHPAR